MKNIKHGTEEIKVTSKICGSYSIRNNNLLIYKGYRSNVYYLTYSNVVIMIGKTVVDLLDSLEKYLNTFVSLDDQLRGITDNIQEPLYRVHTKDNDTISIYKVLEASDGLELLETSEYYGGKYAICNKENQAYAFGLCYDAAKYIFRNNKNKKDMNTNKENYTLYGSQHSWDMNYHLLDNEKKIEYLISTDDVSDDENEGLYIETLLNLEDMDEILSYVWKEERYISDSYVNLLSGSKKTITDLLKELVTN